jgi:hypothetical protein
MPMKTAVSPALPPRAVQQVTMLHATKIICLICGIIESDGRFPKYQEYNATEKL